jgi:hypothetical protein
MTPLVQLTGKLHQLQALRPLEPARIRALEETVIAPFAMEVIATATNNMLDRYLAILSPTNF